MQRVYKEIKYLIKARGKNDEGAWQTSLNDEEILEVLSKFKGVRIGLDFAASTFYNGREYCYKNRSLDKEAQRCYINLLIEKYNLFYSEDPLEEKDFKGFAKIKHTENHLVVGDDITATHIDLVMKAIKNKSVNAVIIKPNQNGSLLELAEIVDYCKKQKIKTVLSHRSGETLDPALADYAFGFQTDFIKTGISTKWREVKLNRLIEIEKSIK